MRQGRAPNPQICVTFSVMKRDGYTEKTNSPSLHQTGCLSPKDREYFIFHSCEVSEGLDVARIHLLLLFCIFALKKTPFALCIFTYMRTANMKQCHCYMEVGLFVRIR